jgi:hypothetical protein
VFEAERKDFNTTYKAAIKVITIPKGEAEIRAVRAEGMDDKSITAYFRTFVEEIVSEFALMSKLKGTANVVSYEDHTVIQHSEGIGWDILIRMELLTPLLDYSTQQPLTRQTIIKLGIDICKALELCQRFDIIHRDIKPENIFISELGDFKLGDFGIARTVEKTTSGLSKKGTYTYMAPEVYRDEAYGSGVDLYSLGIVLYRFLNDNRTPFLPAYPTPITYNDQETARAKRLGGSELPKPKNAEGRLAEIVLKACAFNPKDRFLSPMQMREELEAIQYSSGEAVFIHPRGDSVPILSVDYAGSGDTHPDKPETDETALHDVTELLSKEIVTAQPGKGIDIKKADERVAIKKEKKKTSLAMVSITVAAVLVAVGILIAVFSGGETIDDPGSEPDVVFNTPLPTTEPENNDDLVEPVEYVTDDTDDDISVVDTPEPRTTPPEPFECDNFAAAVREIAGIPDGADIQRSDVEHIRELDVKGRGITSLAGIEYFTSLQVLICQENNITELDISNNLELSILHGAVNRLTYIDVSSNTALTVLDLMGNRILSLDVSRNINLIQLDLMNNPLETLDVSYNEELMYLSLGLNNLMQLDVTANTKLITLNCFSNKLVELDLRHNVDLQYLHIGDNRLRRLDVSANTKLVSLSCEENLLTELDLSNNPNIEVLWVDRNRMASEDSILGLSDLRRLNRDDHESFRFNPQDT